MEKDLEYRTTYALWNLDSAIPDPKPPAGPGWQMCGSSVSPGVLFWFWCRPAQQLVIPEKTFPEDLLSIRVQDLPLSPRVRNRLYESGMHVLGDVVKMTDREMLQIRAFGQGCLNELNSVLYNMGLSLKRSTE
jgi:hypothetical protein